MEKFYALNQRNEYYEFTSWDRLISWLYSFCTKYDSKWGVVVDLQYIGHNFNDTYVKLWPVFKDGRIYNRPTYYNVNFVIFDSDWRVINTDFLFDGIKQYDSKPRKRRHIKRYFEYRKEPVPFAGRWKNGSNIWRRIRKNKSYAAKLEEYYNLFPNDSKIRNRKLLVRCWDDDFGIRTQDKSWKRQRKIKKQWQKNAP